MPFIDGGIKAILVEVNADEFIANPDFIKETRTTLPRSLVVSLGSNPSTGFHWEEVEISDRFVLSQSERIFVTYKGNGILGAPGKDVWIFASLAKDSSTLVFQYSQPW